MEIILATSDRVRELAELFDQYRMFYEQPSDIEAAVAFLNARFENKDSVIYAASDHDRIVGFTQLYPCHSSVAMGRIWILNDLYVKESFRNKQVAKQLMRAANNHALETGALRIELATQVTNIPAQKLYESMGYKQNRAFFQYS